MTRIPRSAALAAAALALGAAGAPAWAGVGGALYERALMTAAGQRCALFAPAVSAALDAGRAQARNAALRSGTGAEALDAVERRAEAAAARTPCDSPDLKVAAARVRDAFEGFASLTRMTYPGEVADWRADRASGRAARWRLAQQARSGGDRVIFGLAGRGGEGQPMAVADFADGRAPYAARLVMRDATRSSGPYLKRRAGEPLRSVELSRRLPPSALTVFTAEARSPAGSDLADKEMQGAWAFRFPAAAAARLAELDPREAIAVEFLFTSRDEEARRVYLEVGDFAAGRAFLASAQR